MYRTIQDFKNDWQYESDATLKFFANINDAALPLKNNADVRSIGRLCWHLTITISEMMSKTGLAITGPNEHSEPPANIEEIVAAYKKSSVDLLACIDKEWNDASLLAEKEMYGEMWKNGKTLSVLITHQTHHRGQLSVLMRQQGIKVPGVYGPAKEDWAQWGMPAAE
jgi:uncharacterized damage-inducible protein DinB